MNRHAGAVTVEFALVFVVLMLLVLGTVEIGRALFAWNSAVEATRVGARAASIAPLEDRAAVLAAMRTVMPDMQDANVVLDYSVDGASFGHACAVGTCRFVRVQLSYAWHPAFVFLQPLTPLLPDTVVMPTFTTTAPVEALGAG